MVAINLYHCPWVVQLPLYFWRVFISASWDHNPLLIKIFTALWLDRWYYHQLFAWCASKSFLPVLFLLDKFRRNCRNDMLFDHMLTIFTGEELALVALPSILDTFLCWLCYLCWVRWIVSWFVRVLVGRQANFSIDRGRHVVPDQPNALSSDWRNHHHISKYIFIPHLEVSVGRLNVHSCWFNHLTFVKDSLFSKSNFLHYDVVARIYWKVR